MIKEEKGGLKDMSISETFILILLLKNLIRINLNVIDFIYFLNCLDNFINHVSISTEKLHCIKFEK